MRFRSAWRARHRPLELWVLGLVVACAGKSEGGYLPGPAPFSGGGNDDGNDVSSGSPSRGGGGAAGVSGKAGAQPAGAGGSSTPKCRGSPDCPSGAFCKAGLCTCPADKPDLCGGACVSLAAGPDNCGRCDQACAPGAACAAGECMPEPKELLKLGDCGSVRLASHDHTLYFTESASGTVEALSAQGALTTLGTGQLKPTQISVDGDGVYWVNQGDGTTVGSSRVMTLRFASASALPQVLVASPSVSTIHAIAVRAGKLYYSLEHDVHVVSTNPDQAGDTVVATATMLSPPGPQPQGEPSGLALDDSRVYWISELNDRIQGDELSAGSQGPYDLGVSHNALREQLARVGSYLYWSDGERIVEGARDGFVWQTLTQSRDFEYITSFTISPSQVYFATEQGGVEVHSITPDDPMSPTPPVRLAREQKRPSSMVLDGERVIWATADCAIRSTLQY